MPFVVAENMGRFGLNTDLLPMDLPPNAITGGINFRPTTGGLESVYYYAQGTDFSISSGAPYYVFYVENSTERMWVYVSNGTVYVSAGGAPITLLSSLSGSIQQGFQFSQFNGLSIFNNGVDPPASWTNRSADAATTPMANWPANYKAKVIRPFKNFLFALNPTDAVPKNYPQRVWWSHPADPGLVPISWDVTQAQYDAGWNDISETPGVVVDGLTLGDSFLVYKTDSVWAFTYVGAPFIFKRTLITKDFGILSADCVVSYPRGHVVLTQNDIVAHDGSGQWQSIVSDRAREEIFQRITPLNLDYAFLCVNPLYKEVWICVPGVITSGGNYPCDLAYTWNWETGSLGKRQLPNVFNGSVGRTTLASSFNDQWSSSNPPTTWAAGQDLWDAPFRGQDIYRLCLGRQATTFAIPDTWDPNISLLDNPAVVIERKGLAIDGKKENGEYKVNLEIRKTLTELFLAIQWGKYGIDPNMSVTISVGGQESVDGPIYVDETISIPISQIIDGQFRVSAMTNRVLLYYSITVQPSADYQGLIRISSLGFNIQPSGSTF